MMIAEAGSTWGSGILLAAGLALIVLTTLASTLSYVLRSYSKSRLADLLGEADRDVWLRRLERLEPNFQVDAGFVRLLSNLATAYWALVAFGSGNPEADWTTLLLPGLWALVILTVASIGLPAALAAHLGELILARCLGLLWGAHFVLYPIERLLLWMDPAVRWAAGRNGDTNEAVEQAEQEILEAVDEGQLIGAVEAEQREMIRSVLELKDTPVSAIMTRRTEIVSIPCDATLEQVRATFIREAHSRIPVYEETIDHVVGVLYAKDLLALEPGQSFVLRDRMRRALFVPESKSIDELLAEFRQSKVQIAIVLDEYGGTAGLATIEDILEELVGEIDDEYDQPEAPTVHRIDENTLEVDGRVPIYEINQELGVELPEDAEFATIGGFVMTTMGKVPGIGEELQHDNIHFSVMRAEPRRINRLRIHVQRQPQSA